MTTDRERFVVVLTPISGFKTPAIARLKGLLKTALRGFGLKAVEVRPIGEAETPSEREIDAWLSR